MIHFTTSDLFNVTVAAGTAIGLIKAFQNIRVQSFMMVLKERWRRRVQDVADSFTVSKMVGELKQTCELQQQTVNAAKQTADTAMQAIESFKQEQQMDRDRIATLEDRYRSVLFYYNLVINYCAQLLDYIHTLRELFAKHQPDVALPVIPAQPDKMGEARTKYLEIVGTKELEG